MARDAREALTPLRLPHANKIRTPTATDREIGEAIAMSGLVRHWSTILNGRQADKAAFKKEVNGLVANARKHMAAAPMPAGKPAPMTMAATK